MAGGGPASAKPVPAHRAPRGSASGRPGVTSFYRDPRSKENVSLSSVNCCSTSSKPGAGCGGPTGNSPDLSLGSDGQGRSPRTEPFTT